MTSARQCRHESVLAQVVFVCLLCLSTAATASEAPSWSRGGIPEAGWVGIYFDTFDRVAASANLEPLRFERLPVGHREIRAWIGGGIGYPQSLYRVIDDGGDVSGELVWHWPARDRPLTETGKTFHDLMRYGLAGRCSEFTLRDSTGTCRVIFDEASDWDGVLRRAEQSGLVTLPDSSELPPSQSMSLDGWTLTIELLDGSNYRTYHYNNPQHREWPEAEQAVQIARIFESVDRLVAPSRVEHRIRGTVRRFEHVLHPCDGSDPWHFRHPFDRLVRPPYAFPETISERYLVNVRAEAMAPWLARERGLSSGRILQGVTFLSIEPAPLVGCSDG